MNLQKDHEPGRRAAFAVLVDNEPGVLHRVVGMFAARGYNIESLTVARTGAEAATSRIAVVTRGAPAVLAQIRAQLEKIIQVRLVEDIGEDGALVEREMALGRIAGDAAQRRRAMALATGLGGRVIDTDADAFIVEMTGPSAAIDRFETELRPHGLVELSRSGVLGLHRAS